MSGMSKEFEALSKQFDETSGRAMAALGLRHDPMRGVWNEASTKDRRFICKIVNIVNEENLHDDGVVRVGVGAWQKSWDELSEHSRVLVSECFMRLRGWVKRLDVQRESGVHHG